MKIFYFITVLILINNCSFDNKTGIWKNENPISKKNEIFDDFKKISYTYDKFEKTITTPNNFSLELPISVENINWKDKYYKENNNFENFAYNEKNNIIFKSKKITRNKTDSYLILNNSNLIVTDEKGNIFKLSIDEKKTISKFNFYKKKYKKIKKKLNVSFEKNLIYVSDNLGYIYALDINGNNVLWAKKYEIPFRSNLKIIEEKLVVSNEKNNLLFLDKNNGELLNLIPTEEIVLQNQFINNISINNKNILYLNSYGSLYSVDSENMKLNWFININQSKNLNATNLFFGNTVICYQNKVMISSNDNTFFVDAKNGIIKKKFNFSSVIKPIFIGKYAFIITDNNYLVSINTTTYEIIFSYSIEKQVAEFLDSKEKKLTFKELMIVNDEILIFLNNSYILKFTIFGELKEIKRLPAKISSNPIISRKSILFLDKKNKLIVVN